jgi:hypothetical protein
MASSTIVNDFFLSFVCVSIVLIVCGVNLNGKHKKLSHPFLGVGFSATHLDRFRITDKFETSDNFTYGRPAQKSAARDGANTAPYPPFPASETFCPDYGTLPSGRNSSGNAFSLNRRAVSCKDVHNLTIN